MKIAVVILNYNGEKFLKKFLPGVVAHSQSDDVGIYVADNASTDNSVSFIKDNFSSVKQIQLNENLGFAGGYNAALSQINASYYILLNSDIEVVENWIQPLISYMDKHPDVAACQPKILSQLNKDYFEHAGACGGFIDIYGYPFCRGRIFNECEKDDGQYDSNTQVFWATGACLCIRKKDFDETGGFDASFFAHMEEIDLCWRLNARGRKIMCIPESKVYHVGGGTLTVENPKKTYLNFRNNLLMIYKNSPKSILYKVLRMRLFLDYIAFLQMVLSGRIDNAKSILKARRDFKDRMSVYKNRREENIRNTIIDSPFGILNESLVYLYYIKNYKSFNQLKF